MKYGTTEWTPVRGGNGGICQKFELQPGEVIRAVYLSTHISYVTNARRTISYTATVICKITFLTNGQTFGPFGSCTEDTEKSFLFPHGIYYFSGGWDMFLNELAFNSLCPNAKIIIPTRGIDY